MQKFQFFKIWPEHMCSYIKHVATNVLLTLTLPDLTKSHKNYLQNTQHMVLRNRPTLIIGTERLACLNSPTGVQLGTLA